MLCMKFNWRIPREVAGLNLLQILETKNVTRSKTAAREDEVLVRRITFVSRFIEIEQIHFGAGGKSKGNWTALIAPGTPKAGGSASCNYIITQIGL